MIICIIGLSGAGKTTLAREVYRLWKAIVPQIVHIDGDEIRSILKQNLSVQDYTIERRFEHMERVLELSLWLDRQGINVISSIVSPFESIRSRYRTDASQYYEVFLDVPKIELRRRDYKRVYQSEKNIVGVDIPFDLPQSDETITNTDSITCLLEHAPQILINSGVVSDKQIGRYYE